jgi:hypothetical protein
MGSYNSSTHPSTYYKARNTPQRITTALGHERTPRKLDVTRCDDAMSSGAASVSNLRSTTLESLSSLSLQGAKTKYHSLRSEASQLISGITCKQKRDTLRTEAKQTARKYHVPGAPHEDLEWKLLYYSFLAVITEEYIMKEKSILLRSSSTKSQSSKAMPTLEEHEARVWVQYNVKHKARQAQIQDCT